MAFTDFGVENLIELIKMHIKTIRGSWSVELSRLRCLRSTPDGYLCRPRLLV